MDNLRDRIAKTIMRNNETNQFQSAVSLAGGIADDLENMPALLAFALHDAFTETELMALRLLIEGSSFQLRDTNFAMRLHAAVCEAIDGVEIY